MKKHHWHVFRHEKLFEKQPLPHCQTPSKACPMLWAHFPFLNGKKKRKTKKNDEIQTLRSQVKQSALCLEQQKKNMLGVLFKLWLSLLMSSRIQYYGFFFLNYEEKILNVNWDLSQIYYNENLIFIDM